MPEPMNLPAQLPPLHASGLALLQRMDPRAAAVERHLWLMEVLEWIRGSHSNPLPPEASVLRVQQLVATAAMLPDWHRRWADWCKAFHAQIDLVPLLADFGFAPRTAFLSELGHRLRRKLLPATPDTTDPAVLFDLLFGGPTDARWLAMLPADTMRALTQMLGTEQTTTPSGLGQWDQALLDAIVFGVSQVSATGFASDIRVRMSGEARRERSFLGLTEQLQGFRMAVTEHGSRSAQAAEAASGLRRKLQDCLDAAQTVYAHLDEYGISVGIVFRLRQLRERVTRIHRLLDGLQATDRPSATVSLLAELVQLGHESRSIRSLVASSSHLTAAKVAERSAETGEHYITRNKAEYRTMLRHAAGGGMLIGFTTWGKFLLYGLALSPFWMGFAAGMNYALSFVLIQLLHWTVATKQPAVTAPAMVAKLADIQSSGAVRAFVDEVAHLFRSQVAAIGGNLALVVPTVLGISYGLLALTGEHMVTAEQAHHVLHDMDVLGFTLLFAAFTGVLLFASSIVAGWFENWFVLHRLDSALAYHPRFTRVLGAERAQRWAHWLRAHVSGLAANISLGLMLGVVPAFAAFFGLGLEVRHVTLSAGQVTAAVATLGLESLGTPGFWLALAGVLLVGPINLGVSFYLAFRLALKARAVSGVNRQRIRAAIYSRIRSQPWSFLLPPNESGTTDTPPHG
jgi:site-specific recombinase